MAVPEKSGGQLPADLSDETMRSNDQCELTRDSRGEATSDRVDVPKGVTREWWNEEGFLD